MKALVKKNPAVGLWMEDVPIPKFSEDEVLIKTIKTAICGTDIHIYKWDAWAQKTIPIPMVIGHEFMGEIAAIGKNVRSLQVGQRVSGEGHITCGECNACKDGKRHLCSHQLGLGVKRHGCFAEYFNLPANNIFPLPDAIPDDVAAILDPFGNAVHTALSTALTGQDVLITGAGPVGIMTAAVARQAGAHRIVITDINDARLALAKKMGATHTINITHQDLQKVMQEAGIESFSVGMEMSGNCDAFNTLLRKAAPGAHIALLGILPPGCVIDWDLVIFKMLKLQGIYGREIFGTWHQMENLLGSGLDLLPIITHRYSCDDYETAFSKMISGDSGKVILNW